MTGFASVRDRLIRALDHAPRTRWGLVAATVGAIGSIGYLAAEQSLTAVPSWAATAVLLVSAAVLWDPARDAARRLGQTDRPWVGYLLAAWPYLLVGGLGCMLLWPLPAGVPPISQDHAQHFQSTVVLAREMLPHGRLFGWTDALAAGVPFGDTYATGVYLITALPHWVTFGAIPLPSSYGIGVFAAWLLVAFAVVAWARRLSGGWLGPVVAGAAFLLDPGGEREGGWLYSIFHAVWPHVFATGLFLWAMLAMVRLAERHTLGRLGAAVLVTGAAFWAHPFNGPSFLVIAPVLILVHLLARPAAGQDDPRRGALWITVAFALAAVIAMGWYTRFFGVEAEDVHMGLVPWRSMQEQALAILRDGLFQNQLMPVRAAAVVGLVALILRHRRIDVVTLLSVMGLFVVASMEPLLGMDLGIHEEHRLVMYRRFSMTLKPLWYAVAGFGVSALVTGLREWTAQLGVHARPQRFRAVALVAAAPLVWALFASLPWLTSGPVGRPFTAERGQLAKELNALDGYLRSEAARLGDRPRKLVRHTGGTPAHYDLFPAADAGFGYLPTARPPASSYKHLNLRPNVEAWRWLGASLLVSALPRQIEGTELVRKFGRFHVYRIVSDPEYPAEVEGPGWVKVLKWSPSVRRFRVGGTGGPTTLLVGMTPYGKWQASQDGKSLPLTETRAKFGYRLTAIASASDGVVELQYRDTPKQTRWLRMAAGVAGGSLLFLLLGWIRLPRVVPDRHLTIATRAGLALFGVMTVALVGKAFAMRAEALEERWARGPNLEVLSVLHQREPDSFHLEPEEYCLEPYDRFPRIGCNPRELAPSPRYGEDKKSRVPACMRLGVPPKGHTTLEFNVPEGAQRVRGRLHPWRRQGGRLEATAEAGNQRIGTIRPRHHFDFELPTGASRVRLTFASKGGKRDLGCLELVAVGAD